MTDTRKYVQAQPFTLSGSGAVTGATTIILQSFAQIDGTLLTMTDFGTKGFGTMEPGNSTFEEQISFTGVTQNANGTATLTGVSTVLNVSPYTETSGLAQTHAGSTSFVISNTAGFYNTFVNKADDEVITGQYQFPNDASTPTLGASYVAPTLDTQVASKKYIDNIAILGAPNATTTTQGLVELGIQSEIDAATAIGGTGASIVATPATTRAVLINDYIASGGTANSITISPRVAVTALAAGQRFTFKVTNTNSATAVLSVSGLTSTAIFKSDGVTGLSPSDFIAGQIVEVEYSGANGFMLMTPVANTVPTGSIQMYAGSAAPDGWLLCDGTSYTRTTYLGLFNIIGTTYGSADGTHFTVPDMRGRVPLGAGTGTGGGSSGTGAPTGGSALTAVSRGTWKGEETHLLTTTEMPAHTHNVTFFDASGGVGIQSGLTSGSHTAATSSAGSDGVHNNIQPVMGLNFIIKA